MRKYLLRFDISRTWFTMSDFTSFQFSFPCIKEDRTEKSYWSSSSNYIFAVSATLSYENLVTTNTVNFFICYWKISSYFSRIWGGFVHFFEFRVPLILASPVRHQWNMYDTISVFESNVSHHIWYCITKPTKSETK